MLEYSITYEVKDTRLFGPYLCNYARLFEDHGKTYLGLFDMERGHAFEGRLIKDTPDGVIWETEDGATIELIELTLDVFERDWRRRCDNPPAFASDVEMQSWFWRVLETGK